MSDLYDAGQSPLTVAHRHLIETDPLYRISMRAAPIALAIGVIAGVACLVWPVSAAAPLPPPAVPAAPSSPPAPPQPQSSADQLEALRDRAVSDSSALGDLQKQADAGNAEAEFYLATLYDPTIPSAFATKDISTSFGWYLKSAELGFPSAEATVGQAYQTGWGVAQNNATAARWFLNAAEYGNPLALYQIGMMNAQGQGVPKNCAVAKTWLQDAKNHGNQNAAGALSSGAAGACQW